MKAPAWGLRGEGIIAISRLDVRPLCLKSALGDFRANVILLPQCRRRTGPERTDLETNVQLAEIYQGV